MATTAGDQLSPDNVSANKKKARMNPARRRALKVKEEASKLQTETSAINGPTDTAPKPSEELNAQPAPKTATKKKPMPTIPLPRQNSDPLALGKKPNLSRTWTTPLNSNSKSTSLALTAPALVTGGLVGCAAGAAIMLGVSIWYDFSGAESAILAARAAKLCVDNLAEEIITSLRSGTYSADEALDMLRRTTLAYASTIPEGAPFVERIFREIDTVRKQRGREIDKVVAETHAELSKAGSRGATPIEMRRIVVRQLMKLSNFASKATQDVVARNPSLKPYREEAARSLRGPPESKVPTVQVNMAVRQKQATDS